MAPPLVELGRSIRRRNAADLMKRLAPEIAEIRSDFERLLAEKDAVIAALRKSAVAVQETAPERRRRE